MTKEKTNSTESLYKTLDEVKENDTMYRLDYTRTEIQPFGVNSVTEDDRGKAIYISMGKYQIAHLFYCKGYNKHKSRTPTEIPDIELFTTEKEAVDQLIYYCKEQVEKYQNITEKVSGDFYNKTI